MINSNTMFKISNLTGSVGVAASATIYTQTMQDVYLYILIADAIVTLISLLLGIFANGINAVKDAKDEKSDGGKAITIDEWSMIFQKMLITANSAKKTLDAKVDEVKQVTDNGKQEDKNDANH
jgi:hypothetical protein